MNDRAHPPIHPSRTKRAWLSGGSEVRTWLARIWQPLGRRFTFILAPRVAVRRTVAQSMVEFALVLPVLLALLFIIIEGGRLFQVWLSIQNSARFAVRYAVTGDFDPQYCPYADSLLTHDARLNPLAEDYAAADAFGGSPVDCVVPDSYTPSTPGLDVDTMSSRLQDAARIPSIVDVATNGAVAISRTPGTTQIQKGYFQVTICSSRDMDANLNTTDLVFYSPTPTTYGRCVWQTAPGGPVDYMDAGGPNDRVLISVEFNHPLITPFLMSEWQYLHLIARREGIVENFRASRAISVPPPIGLPPEQITPATETLTPTLTETPGPTSTSTPTMTTTPTNPPVCAGLDVTDGLEALNVQDLSRGGNILEVGLNNASGDQVNLIGASITYNGLYHNDLEPRPSWTFDRYHFDGTDITTDIDEPNTSALAFSHQWANDVRMPNGRKIWFKWVFTDPFYDVPYLLAYPAGSPVGGLNPSPTSSQLFFHSADFTATIYYTVGAGTNLPLCSKVVSGRSGPTIFTEIVGNVSGSSVGGNSDFSMRATVNGDDSNIDVQSSRSMVFFYVYDSTGTLVYWTQADNNHGPYCLFGNGGGTDCVTKRSWVDDWPGTSTRISGGNYTVAVLARNADSGVDPLAAGDTARNKTTIRTFPLSISNPSSLRIEIVVPSINGQQIDTLDQTAFQAIAWDTAFGINPPDGSGIGAVAFELYDPSTRLIYTWVDYVASYCAFQGNGPCSTMMPGPGTPEVPNFEALANGVYTLRARAQGNTGANDGLWSVWASRPFVIDRPTPTITLTPTQTRTSTITRTPTITLTPTITRTPTITYTATVTPLPSATPSCSDLAVGNLVKYGDSVILDATNNSPADFPLTSVNLSWSANLCVSYTAWNPTGGVEIPYDHSNSCTSPSGRNNAMPRSFPAGSTYTLRNRMNVNFDVGVWGYFKVVLTFANRCTFTRELTLATLTPTNTATVTNTPTKTATRTNTPTPTNTPTITNTPTDTPVPTPTEVPTITLTPLPSRTPSPSPTPSFTITPTYCFDC